MADGLFHNSDGSREFTDGSGVVHGANLMAQRSSHHVHQNKAHLHVSGVKDTETMSEKLAGDKDKETHTKEVKKAKAEALAHKKETEAKIAKQKADEAEAKKNAERKAQFGSDGLYHNKDGSREDSHGKKVYGANNMAQAKSKSHIKDDEKTLGEQEEEEKEISEAHETMKVQKAKADADAAKKAADDQKKKKDDDDAKALAARKA